MYRIKLGFDSRIVEASYVTQKAEEGIYINEFPGSPIDDYKYVDGKVIHDPRADRPAYNPDAPTEVDQIKAQVTYTALKTGTLIGGSK